MSMTPDSLQNSRIKLSHPGQITLGSTELFSVLQHSHLPLSLLPEGREPTSDVIVLERTAPLPSQSAYRHLSVSFGTVTEEMLHAFSAVWGFPENDKAIFPFLTISKQHLLAQSYSLGSGCALRLGLQPRMLLEGA